MPKIKPPIELCDLRVLKNHEKTDPQRLSQLLDEICSCGFWTHPIVIEREHGVILDGHHRFEVAKTLRLKRLPVILVDYFDEQIQVCQRRRIKVSKQMIIRRAKNQKPLPCKTTRHTCVINGSHCPILELVPKAKIPLTELR